MQETKEMLVPSLNWEDPLEEALILVPVDSGAIWHRRAVSTGWARGRRAPTGCCAHAPGSPVRGVVAEGLFPKVGLIRTLDC